MLMLAPVGRINLVILASIFVLNSKQCRVTGSVAIDEAVANAAVSAVITLPITWKGVDFVTSTEND